MRILLDESVPRQLTRFLKGHEVQTVPRRGWAGVRNGELLRRAATEFDVFVTVDQNLQHGRRTRRRVVGPERVWRRAVGRCPPERAVGGERAAAQEHFLRAICALGFLSLQQLDDGAVAQPLGADRLDLFEQT